MRGKYVYKSIALHIAVVLLCIFDLPYFSSMHDFEENPPILVDLNDVTIADITNLPELAVRGETRKVATRKEKPETSASKQPKAEPEPEDKPVIETPEIKAPSLIEDDSQEQPSKEDKKSEKKKRPAPIPQKKPQIKPDKKPEAQKPQKTANPLDTLMNSVDDLQKQIGEEDSPAKIPFDEPVNNMGIEGGNNKGSYFSEITVSGQDYFAAKIKENWKTIVGGKDDRNIKVLINLYITRDGEIQKIEFNDMSRYKTDSYYAAIADSAERAIILAQTKDSIVRKLVMQNLSDYETKLKVNHLTFTPLGLVTK